VASVGRDVAWIRGRIVGLVAVGTLIGTLVGGVVVGVLVAVLTHAR
jgi:MFS family permease